MSEIGSIAKYGDDFFKKTAEDSWSLLVVVDGDFLRNQEVDRLGSVVYEATALVRFGAGTILSGRTNSDILASKDDRGRWRFAGENDEVFSDDAAEKKFNRYWGGYEVLLEVKR